MPLPASVIPVIPMLWHIFLGENSDFWDKSLTCREIGVTSFDRCGSRVTSFDRLRRRFTMTKRGQFRAQFKARWAVEANWGEEATNELAANQGLHPSLPRSGVVSLLRALRWFLIGKRRNAIESVRRT